MGDNDSAADAVARGRAAVSKAARFHLSPLALVELAAFGVAVVAGWTLIAAAILVVHLIHMGFRVARG